MVHHEFTTFSQKDYISHFGNAWETLDYKARRSSSTVAISGCHSANLWIGKKMLQMVLQIVFFFGYFKPKNYNLCVIFCTRKTCFLHFLMQHPQHMFCLFLRAPNRALVCLSSCPISCFFLRFCAPNRALNCAIVTGHEKDTICTYVCGLFQFISSINGLTTLNHFG